MVLIICTKNKSNLTNRHWDMVPDGQKVDGMDGRRQNYISDFVGDKNPVRAASEVKILDFYA